MDLACARLRLIELDTNLYPSVDQASELSRSPRIAAIYSGSIPQHPPMIVAPISIHILAKSRYVSILMSARNACGVETSARA